MSFFKTRLSSPKEQSEALRRKDTFPPNWLPHWQVALECPWSPRGWLFFGSLWNFALGNSFNPAKCRAHEGLLPIDSWWISCPESPSTPSQTLIGCQCIWEFWNWALQLGHSIDYRNVLHLAITGCRAEPGGLRTLLHPLSPQVTCGTLNLQGHYNWRESHPNQWWDLL